MSKNKNKNQAIKATGRSAPKLERNGENSVTILPAAVFKFRSSMA